VVPHAADHRAATGLHAAAHALHVAAASLAELRHALAHLADALLALRRQLALVLAQALAPGSAAGLHVAAQPLHVGAARAARGVRALGALRGRLARGESEQRDGGNQGTDPRDPSNAHCQGSFERRRPSRETARAGFGCAIACTARRTGYDPPPRGGRG